jgi:hypothetical protein
MTQWQTLMIDNAIEIVDKIMMKQYSMANERIQEHDLLFFNQSANFTHNAL